MSLEAAIAQGHALLAAKDMTGLATLLPTLEAAQPATEPQWAGLCAIFTGINRPPWVEIMTERFLAAEPDNLAVRLQSILIMSQVELRRDDAMRKLAELGEPPFDQPAHYITYAEIFTRLGDHATALAWLKRAKTAYPDNTHIWIVVIHAMMRLQQTAQIKAELTAHRAYSRGHAERLLLVATMALWNKDTAFALPVLKEVEPLLTPDGHQDRATFIVHARRVGQMDLVVRHVPLLDVRQLWSPQLLDELFRALEGRGLHDAERQIVATALERVPDDDIWLKRARALSASRPDFMSAAAAPPPQPNRPGLLGRLRDRLGGR
jgi:tetratricopeptide (TPR) repeat protein